MILTLTMPRGADTVLSRTHRPTLDFARARAFEDTVAIGGRAPKHVGLFAAISQETAARMFLPNLRSERLRTPRQRFDRRAIFLLPVLRFGDFDAQYAVGDPDSILRLTL